VCADIAFGLGARIEGWSPRSQEKAREERRRKKKKPLEVVDDAIDHGEIGDKGDDLHRSPAPGAG
jgi:hypothetical protein